MTVAKLAETVETRQHSARPDPEMQSDTVNSLCLFYGLVVRVPGYKSRGPGSDFPALQDFLSSGSGMGSTQPREDN
jgi:hypothetical protein